ncbi:unnamed protein product [Ectocarpus sp. CCAP 1310/34]|nr:unnamed protein product [Ectocarpus sp. CCAP 1310/34]
MEASGLAPEEVVLRLLDVIEKDIVPITTEAVKKGNKVFGAAILKLADLSLVVAGTNTEIECPLWHGEVACIKNFWNLPEEGRPLPSECLMLATHEPCSMCVSAITWSAFKVSSDGLYDVWVFYSAASTNGPMKWPPLYPRSSERRQNYRACEIHFLFSMEDSRDAFNIPHDLRIYQEVFKCERATRDNKFWKAYDLPKVVETLPESGALGEKVTMLRETYASLSELYQDSKGGASSTRIPLS